jgi:glycine dehydrogenase
MSHTAPPVVFADRHIGLRASDLPALLAAVGVESLDQLIDQAIPADIRFRGDYGLPAPVTEAEALAHLADLAGRNQVLRSFLGQGYHACHTPSPILRNVLENPQWYTPYTPYQAEISQGRLEALLNFQTLVTDLTGLDLANASLLDEATAAAEAMTLCHRMLKRGDTRSVFLADVGCHPQTLAVLRTRAEPLGLTVREVESGAEAFTADAFAVLLQHPDTRGRLREAGKLVQAAKARGLQVVIATDPLALTVIASPGELGADVAVGNAQRFGMPTGFGGPHAAFMAVRHDHARQIPGRIVGVSRDRLGAPGLRLALQTREQHIRRDKATSNICTAQALPAIVSSFYAVYHGPDRLRRIALATHARAARLAHALAQGGWTLAAPEFFDTVTASSGPRPGAEVVAAARAGGINLRLFPDGAVGVAFNETTTDAEVAAVARVFGVEASLPAGASAERLGARRTAPLLPQPVFNTHHSETELMRYMDDLQKKDLALTDCMIPLGSCTMKLNAATEMMPVTWPGFARLHPYAPADQAAGYRALTDALEDWLARLTGFAAVSLQPNSGSQGEYAGLLAIRAWHTARGQAGRDVCLIPLSAHGTNPASAALCGMEVVVVKCDADGNIDLPDLRAKAAQHADRLSALMVTYPSTHGVFEATIREVCRIVHEHGGQVYLDGANMNAMVGLCRPGDIGADVCHLNLHKTFCIPHGGGGPGMGPIGVAAHLAPHLPGPAAPGAPARAGGMVSATPYGSGCILPISYTYILMMGAEQLARATRTAILAANYIAARLDAHYPVLYKGAQGRVAHECIVDCRGFKSVGVEAEDIAKRLMDYGFHAPTLSFPVPGTLMIEPTESEPKAELDRFCAAMIAIREEIREIETGAADRADNVLKHAPHPVVEVCADTWPHAYSREKAAFPVPSLRTRKYWPPIARVDNVYGDRNLQCTCAPVSAYAAADKG